MTDKLADRVIDAVVRSVDRAALERALESITPKAPPASGSGGRTSDAIAHKIVLSDILDDAILGARPNDPSYPLRMFFATLGDELDDDLAFSLVNGLNFYFRVGMDEEPKLAVAIEISRLYYRYAAQRPLDAELVRPLSALLARLMSTELETVRLEAVDAARVFDGGVHERELGSDASNPQIRAPKSFLCRVVSNGRVRVKALVGT
ncbi:MAG: hypothetical protein AB7S26_16775 [Sandaracinaceae bacterium]